MVEPDIKLCTQLHYPHSAVLWWKKESRSSNKKIGTRFNNFLKVIDLLSKTRKPGGLKIREDQQRGFYVDGWKLVPCDNSAQIERSMEQGTKMRTTATTTMNATGSRSHHPIQTGGFSFYIAAVSPAGICHQEALSTLRYAERYDFVIFPSLVLAQTAIQALGKMTKETSSK
ncbi:kinesin-like protein KIF18A [Theristicus caerulescens]